MVVAITACTGDPAPVGTVPNGSPTSSSASPTIAEPVRPIDKATPESAIQFTRYFWDLYNYAYQTYDTAPLKAISDPSCRYCSSTIDDVKRISDAQTRVTGFGMVVLELASPPVKITTGTVVVVAMKQRDGVSTRLDGSTKRLNGFKDHRFTLGLSWSDQGWTIQGVDYDDTGEKS